MNQIIYGVGKTILKEFADLTKVLALAKLKNVTVDMTSNEEKLTAGDDPYPFASFPKDKAIKVTAESALFSLKLLNATQGATISTGKVLLSDAIEIIIPDDGILNLPNEVSGSLVVEDFTTALTVGAVATGKYFPDVTDKTLLTFAVADKGKTVLISYDYDSSALAESISITKDTLAKPFKFIHTIPIWDDNNVHVADGQLIVFKCKANNSFNFNLQPQTAFAPKIEFEAQDPKRADGKLWDFIVNPLS